MNNLEKVSDRIKFLRGLLGYSQMQMAKRLNIPQPNYARYETGLTKKIPYSLLSSISTQFGIDIEWLNSGIVDLDRCKSIEDHVRNNVNMKLLAEKIDVTESFFNAILHNELSPSRSFYEKTLKAMTFSDTPVFAKSPLKKDNDNVDDQIAYLKYRIEKLNQELSEKEKFIDKLFMENERLKLEVEQLKNQIRNGGC